MASVTKDLDAFKRTYRKTGSVRQAALSAGYSKNVANTGTYNLPKTIQQYVATKRRKLNKLSELGKTLDAQSQENLVRGALLSNVAEGKDRAHASIKLLGQDKRVNMFTPDSVAGVVIIQAVPLPDLSDCPTIDAQVTDNE